MPAGFLAGLVKVIQNVAFLAFPAGFLAGSLDFLHLYFSIECLNSKYNVTITDYGEHNYDINNDKTDNSDTDNANNNNNTYYNDYH